MKKFLPRAKDLFFIRTYTEYIQNFLKSQISYQITKKMFVLLYIFYFCLWKELKSAMTDFRLSQKESM